MILFIAQLLFYKYTTFFALAYNRHVAADRAGSRERGLVEATDIDVKDKTFVSASQVHRRGSRHKLYIGEYYS